MDYTCHYYSPLGGITLASDGEALIGLWFDGQRHFAQSLGPHHESKMLPVLEDTCRWLDIYLSGREPGFTPRLCPRGTTFQKQVWGVLLTIPFGQTMTYGEIARSLARIAQTANVAKGRTAGVGEPNPRRVSVRAVGGAVGRNPIALIIPCHRVIGSDGHLTGYAAGLDKKKRLLQLEQVDEVL